MPKVTTYLCDEGLSGISVSDSDRRKSLDALSVERNETSAVVRTKIATVACSPGAVPKRVVSVKLLPLSGLVDCALLDEHIGDAELSWAREIACDNGGNFVSRDRHITIDVSHPDDPCHWKNSALRGIRKTGEIRTYWSTVPAIVSDGLLPDSKSDLVAFDRESRIENGQTQFVPGELLQLLWALKYRDEWVARYVAGSFFATPAFTGGTVTGILNDETENKLVAVNVQNVTRSCMPTDWAAYNAGAWAFVLKQGDSAATETNRRSAFGDSDTSGDSSQETGMIGQILNLINNAREAAGLLPMSISPTLTGSAENHSNDMAAHQLTSHTGSDGSTTEGRIRATGYFDLGDGLSAAAENVASGYQTAEAVFTGWMNSPGHRANIMNPDFVVVGMAVKYDDDGVPYYTQNFGSLDDKSIPVSNPDYRVVPITVNNYGNGGDFETIDYDMLSAGNFEEFFEISQHIGVVTAVDTDNDTADITVDKLGAGSFEDVPIFYHCEDSNTVAGGSAAFSVGDEVLVLNEGGKPYPSSGDLVIVGFKDELKSCTTDGYLLIQLDDEYVIWNIASGALATLPPGLSYPLTLAHAVDYLSSIGIVFKTDLAYTSGGAAATESNGLSAAESKLQSSYVLTMERQKGCPTEDPYWDIWDQDRDSVISSGAGHISVREVCLDEETGFYSHSATVDESIVLNRNVNVPDYKIFVLASEYENQGSCYYYTSESFSSVISRQYEKILSITFDLPLHIISDRTGFIWQKSKSIRTSSYSGVPTDCNPGVKATVVNSYEQTLLYQSYIHPSLSQIILESNLPHLAFRDHCCHGACYNQYAVCLEQPLAVSNTITGGFAQISVQKDGVYDPALETYQYSWDNFEMVPMSNILNSFSKTLHEDILERGPSTGGIIVKIYGRE